MGLAAFGVAVGVRVALRGVADEERRVFRDWRSWPRMASVGFVLTLWGTAGTRTLLPSP